MDDLDVDVCAREEKPGEGCDDRRFVGGVTPWLRGWSSGRVGRGGC